MRNVSLAGLAGHPGVQDGAGAKARFHQLGGLTLGMDGDLYVVDGHALRRVSPAGEVVTVLGQPDRPGFQDLPGGAAATVPCLRDPGGVLSVCNRLYLADTGNHALRQFELRTGALKTLAGDPAQAELRFGPLKDPGDGTLQGLPGSPREVARGEAGDLWLSTGSCLVRVALD